MLTKETIIDKIEVIENGGVQVRRAVYILEDGIRIAGPIYERISYQPDTPIENEHPKVKAIASAAWEDRKQRG